MEYFTSTSVSSTASESYFDPLVLYENFQLSQSFLGDYPYESSCLILPEDLARIIEYMKSFLYDEELDCDIDTRSVSSYCTHGSDHLSTIRRVPLAGQSILKFDKNKKSEQIHSIWLKCEASSFLTRSGDNYRWNKNKAPSSNALFNIVGVETKQFTPNIGSQVKLNDNWMEGTHLPLVPSLFIVNFHLPSQPLSNGIFSSADINGAGWSLVFYFHITEDTKQQLISLESAAPAVRLMAEYFEKAPELESSPYSPWKGRFKFIVRNEDMEKSNVPSFIASYNAKPILLRKSGALVRGENNRYIEMDVNVNQFGSVAVAGFQSVIDIFGRSEVSLGFCIESRDDSEMPETILGCVTVKNVKLKNATELPT